MFLYDWILDLEQRKVARFGKINQSNKRTWHIKKKIIHFSFFHFHLHLYFPSYFLVPSPQYSFNIWYYSSKIIFFAFLIFPLSSWCICFPPSIVGFFILFVSQKRFKKNKKKNKHLQQLIAVIDFLLRIEITNNQGAKDDRE